MNILYWVVLGGIAGWLAGLVVKNARMGILANIVVGIIGAFVGGFVFNFFGGYGINGFTLHSLIVAFVGAVICLFAVRLIRR